MGNGNKIISKEVSGDIRRLEHTVIDDDAKAKGFLEVVRNALVRALRLGESACNASGSNRRLLIQNRIILIAILIASVLQIDWRVDSGPVNLLQLILQLIFKIK